MATRCVSAREQSHPAAERLEGRLFLSTYLVTNIMDGGAGSLRQAILDANAHAGTDLDVIDFAIGSGPVTIRPLSKLPDIAGPVILDGTSQPGYADFGGKPIVEINGSNAGTVNVDGLKLTGGNSVIRGLIVNNFSGSGVVAQDAGGDVFENSYIGTDASGENAAANGVHGIILTGADDRVGGTGLSQRNVISGNRMGGIVLLGTKRSVIQGNLIGLDANGAVAIENGTGISEFGGCSDDTIGGAATGAGNVISGNQNIGILTIGSVGTRIAGNTIGLDSAGRTSVANRDTGVAISDSTSVLIGGADAGSANLISGNLGAGIEFSGGGSNIAQGNLLGPAASPDAPDVGNGAVGVRETNGTAGNLVAKNVISGNRMGGVLVVSGVGNRISANSIYANASLGIDLGGDGITPVTPGGPHVGPNNLQNYPSIQSAATDGFATTVSGTFNSTPASTFMLEFFGSPFPDPSGFGEGKTYLGSASVTTDQNGDATFSLALAASPTLEGYWVTATATAADGSTSEFSKAQQIAAAPPPVVTATGFNYLRFPHEVTFRFSQRVIDSIGPDDLTIQRLPSGPQFTPTGVRYEEATQMAAFELPPSLPDGNYRATLRADGVNNAAGTPMAADVTADFFEFRGDANHDRAVNFTDLVALAQHYNSRGDRTWADGDFDGDGDVDFTDLVTLAQRYNTTLPVAASASSAAANVIATPAPPVAASAPRTLPAQKMTSVFSTIPLVKPAAVVKRNATVRTRAVRGRG